MKPMNILKVAKNSLLITVAVSGLGLGVVVASTVDGYVSPQRAAKAESEASQALSNQHYSEAITLGEEALKGAPRNANYRMTLGLANLSAGRFASAETLFGDVLTLDPTNARAALNLALTQVALDHASEARATLEIHHDQISPADYGLALALAGDATGAVRTLEAAARTDGATAKTRQNLALAYALSGRWDEAKTTAAQDLSPDLVDKRMSDWAQMAHPKAAWEQVAALLHVAPANDPGLPYQLALNSAAAAPEMAVAKASPPPAAVTTAASSSEATTARYETSGTAPATASFESAPARGATAETGAPSIAFASSHPVVQPTPTVAPQVARLIHAAAGPTKRSINEQASQKALGVAHAVAAHPLASLIKHHSFSTGYFAVQIGAYKSVALAKSAWNRDVKKVSALRSYDPAQSHFNVHSASYYRLAVTGFNTRYEAGAVCAKLRASGGNCFVRSVNGDQLASWVHPRGGIQMAAHAHAAAPKVAAKMHVTPPAKPATPVLAKAQPQSQIHQIGKINNTQLAKSVLKPMSKPSQVAGGQLAARR